MPRTFFEGLEEGRVFTISQVFWHFCVAICGIGILAGLATLFWSLLPSSRPSTAKVEYPAVSTVTADEVMAVVSPSKRRDASLAVGAVPATTVPKQAASADVLSPEFPLLDMLRALLPPAKYSCAGTGRWFYPIGLRYPTFRNWIPGDAGILEKLDGIYANTGAIENSER
jgi:hypothetical protein